MEIREGGLDDPRVVDLVNLHSSLGLAQSDPGTAHPLDIAKLRSPNVRFWTVWDGGELLGCGALRLLSAEHGELKTMHTVERARCRGIASALLAHIVLEASRDGIVRLSLRTGSQAYFAPARDLYRRHGFTECPPFIGHTENSGSVFMTREVG